jgi:hypothetical protein
VRVKHCERANCGRACEAVSERTGKRMWACERAGVRAIDRACAGD